MTTADKKKINPIEKAKAQKHPLLLKQELEQLAQVGWEAMDEFERDHGLKWLGFFYRSVTPGQFMLRRRIANGIILRELLIKHFGARPRQVARVSV